MSREEKERPTLSQAISVDCTVTSDHGSGSTRLEINSLSKSRSMSSESESNRTSASAPVDHFPISVTRRSCDIRVFLCSCPSTAAFEDHLGSISWRLYQSSHPLVSSRFMKELCFRSGLRRAPCVWRSLPSWTSLRITEQCSKDPHARLLVFGSYVETIPSADDFSKRSLVGQLYCSPLLEIERAALWP